MALRDQVDASKAAKLEGMADAQAEAVAWIEAVTGKPFDSPFEEYLHDGKVLCELVNAVEPGMIKKINSSTLAFKQMENISMFLRAAKEIGVPEGGVCDTADLYQSNDIGRVIQTLHSFGGAVQKRGVYKGPTLGKSVLDANKREFTQEQLIASAALSGGTMLTKGSQGVMERNDVTKTGAPHHIARLPSFSISLCSSPRPPPRAPPRA